MNNWLIVITATVTLILLLSRVNIFIDVLFCRRKEDDYIAVTVHLLRRLLVYKVKIPVIEIVLYNDLPWLRSEIKTQHAGTDTHVDREQRFIKKLVDFLIINPQKLQRILKSARHYIRVYRWLVRKFAACLHCEKMYLKVTYGFEDPAVTGMMMGFLGAVEGIALTNLYNRIIIDTKPEIKLIPIYGQSHLEVEFKCIFRIRLGNVITATISALTNSMHREATRSG